MDSLQVLSDRWIALRNTAKPSVNTIAARERDLAVIAGQLAGGPDAALSTLTVADLSRRRLEAAFASYASSYAPRSTQRVMSSAPL